MELNARVRNWMREHDIAAYDEVAHTGCVRNLMTRKGFKSGELMVVLVTLGEALPFEAELLAALADLPVTTWCRTSTRRAPTASWVTRTGCCWAAGDPRQDPRARIRDLALSFFQNNPSQTDVLYSKALEYCELTGSETVFDIYCGIGTISLFLAGKAAKVVGIESVESAISDARRNAALNGIEQTEFHVGKAEQLMPALHADGVSADVVVMDPPARAVTRRYCRPWWPWRRAVWSMSPATPDPGPGSRLAGQAGLRAGRGAAGGHVPALHARGKRLLA